MVSVQKYANQAKIHCLKCISTKYFWSHPFVKNSNTPVSKALLSTLLLQESPGGGEGGGLCFFQIMCILLTAQSCL